MTDHLTIVRGVVTAGWPDQSDTDQHYDVADPKSKLDFCSVLMLFATGGYFGALVYFWLGGS